MVLIKPAAAKSLPCIKGASVEKSFPLRHPKGGHSGRGLRRRPMRWVTEKFQSTRKIEKTRRGRTRRVTNVCPHRPACAMPGACPASGGPISCPVKKWAKETSGGKIPISISGDGIISFCSVGGYIIRPFLQEILLPGPPFSCLRHGLGSILPGGAYGLGLPVPAVDLPVEVVLPLLRLILGELLAVVLILRLVQLGKLLVGPDPRGALLCRQFQPQSPAPVP